MKIRLSMPSTTSITTSVAERRPGIGVAQKSEDFFRHARNHRSMLPPAKSPFLFDDEPLTGLT